MVLVVWFEAVSGLFQRFNLFGLKMIIILFKDVNELQCDTDAMLIKNSIKIHVLLNAID